METIIIKYKTGNKFFKRTKKLVFEIFTDAEEIPYHRFFLAVKLITMSNEVSANTSSIAQRVEDALSLIIAKKIGTGVSKLNSILTTLKMVEGDVMLDMAGFYPFVKSINGKQLPQKLAVDEALELATKYADITPVSLVKKK